MKDRTNWTGEKTLDDGKFLIDFKKCIFHFFPLHPLEIHEILEILSPPP